MAVVETQASLWPRLAWLPLVIESYELERVDPDRPSAFERYTTHVRLIGGGTDGLGEEISMPDDQAALQDAGPGFPRGRVDARESFCDHLGTVDQWPNEPKWEQMRLYRNNVVPPAVSSHRTQEPWH